jgi:hypothetical protein
MIIMCSLEICLRLYKASKRVMDPDLDNLTNPHEVKHWMDPKIIPYGWGMLVDQDNSVEHVEGSPCCVIIPILSVDTVSTPCRIRSVIHGSQQSNQSISLRAYTSCKAWHFFLLPESLMIAIFLLIINHEYYLIMKMLQIVNCIWG